MRLDRHLQVQRDPYELIDFSFTGSGAVLPANTYVKRQWKGSHGLVIKALLTNGGYAPQSRSRILDTAHPTANATNFGSPNANCGRGGPGIGSGGDPTQPGGNCVAQGNVLIIQESDTIDAAVNPNGGVFDFTFLSPTRVVHMGLMGIEEGTATMQVMTDKNQTIDIPIAGLGDNSVEQVHIGYVVQHIQLTLTGPGAVTEIGIFTPLNASEAVFYDPKANFTYNISLFEEYIPYLQFDLSYYLTRRINRLFGSIPGGCLEDTWIQIDVNLEKVKEIPVAHELNCSKPTSVKSLAFQSYVIWTFATSFTVQHPVELTGNMLNLTSAPENKEITDAFNATIRNAINLPAATIFNVLIAAVNATSNATCPAAKPTFNETICSKVYVSFRLEHLNSTYPSTIGNAVITNLSDAINEGYLQCRHQQLYPNSSILIRSGLACPETSAAPTSAPTRAPTMPPSTVINISNAFFISNSAGIDDMTLNTVENPLRAELEIAYKLLLNYTIAIDVANGVKLMQIGSMSVSTIPCPKGLAATCHLVTTGFVLQYYPSLFSGTPNINVMQMSINDGNLICEHNRLYPSSLLTVRSGNRCPTDTLTPTVAPAPTDSPTGPPTSSPLASATLNIMFRILHPSSITIAMLRDPSSTAAMQLLAAYTSVVNTSLEGFTSQNPVSYGGYSLTTISDLICSSWSSADSLCNTVSASVVFNFTSSDANAETTASDLITAAITSGKLDCELKRLYPTTLLQVTTGGVCPSSAIVYDKLYTITNQFYISNTANLSDTNLIQTGNPQKAELEAAFNAMLLSLLKGPIESGAAVLQRPGIITSFQVEPKCTSVTVCHFVSVEFKLKCNSTLLLPLDGLAVLNLVQTAINYGTMICYHTKLYGSSIVKVTTGETCKQTL